MQHYVEPHSFHVRQAILTLLGCSKFSTMDKTGESVWGHLAGRLEMMMTVVMMITRVGCVMQAKDVDARSKLFPTPTSSTWA